MPPTLKSREREIEEDDEGFIADKTPAKAKEDDGLGTMLESEDDDNAIAKREQAIEQNDVEEDQDARLAYDLEAEDSDGPQERDSRRRRRNRARKAAQQQSATEIAALNQRVAQLSGMVDQMSRGQVGLAAGDLDSRIGATQQQLDAIDAALAKAVKEGDDVTYARGMQLRDEAKDRLQQFAYARQRLVAEAGQQQREQPNPALQRQNGQQRAPDPVAVKYSERFLERHPWFDPTDATDEDSLMVRAIDEALGNEGWRANTKMYWVEFERRVKARGIGPQNDDGDDDMNDDQDEQPQRRAPRRVEGGQPPRAGRTGGRPAGKTSFRLDQNMQDALDAEGLLDEKNLTDDQKKYRRRLVSTWKDGFDKVAAAARR